MGSEKYKSTAIVEGIAIQVFAIAIVVGSKSGAFKVWSNEAWRTCPICFFVCRIATEGHSNIL